MMPPISPWARKYVGTRFVRKGRSFEGVDCYGLHWLIELTEAGVELPLLDFDFNPRRCDEIAGLFGRGKPMWRQIDAQQDRCVVLLLTGGVPAHIGVVCGPDVMIHADDEHGQVVVERLRTPIWPESRIEGFYVFDGGAQ